MRAAFFVAGLAAAAIIAPDALRGALATAASALLEATPFAIAGIALRRLTRWPEAAAFLSCGCAPGPSARSIPAAIAAAFVFGPAVAIARLAAGTMAARVLQHARNMPAVGASCHDHSELLGELAALLPAALIAGGLTLVTPWIDLARWSPAEQIAGGMLLGFVAAPCGLGAVAVGAALHRHAPSAAAAFLWVAGIVDLRALAWRLRPASGPDGVAYAALAAALAIVGWRRGGALVHPAIAGALIACAAMVLVSAIRHRARSCTSSRYAPLLVLAAALIAAPAPVYRATESTLTDIFPGERLTFAGVLVRATRSAALVRYAITCCRADAAPVVVRLARIPPFVAGTWLRANGTIAIEDGAPLLVTDRVEPMPPPADPFTYL